MYTPLALNQYENLKRATTKEMQSTLQVKPSTVCTKDQSISDQGYKMKLH